MASGLWRNLLAPPAYSEVLTPAQWRRALYFSMVFSLLAVGIDVFITLVLRRSAAIDPEALAVFASYNISVLLVIAAYSAAALRSAALRKSWLLSASAVLIASTIIVWVQLTGTLTSYFMIFAIALIPVYRVYVGYTTGLVATASIIAFHVGAILLEAGDVLEPRSLFTSQSGPEYALAGYRYVVMVSIAWSYLFIFIAANVIMKKLREKEEALARVRHEMAQVAEGIKHGRLSGTVLSEEYALGELLGRGGMGEVYAARRISNDDRVAVKVLHAHLVEDDTMLGRFRREAEVAERVPHEHTARVFEVGTDEEHGLHFIAMEYLRGEDLAAYLRRQGPIRLHQLVALARELAEALDAAHEAGVVHRDLKPQNVILVARDESVPDLDRFPYRVRLVDFGVSKLLEGHTTTLTRANALLGTPGYMAPEQALGRMSQIGFAADRFALAAILYRALTGRPPFRGGDLMLALREVIHTDPPPPSSLVSGITPAVDAVFAIGLAKEILDRYESARAMASDLAAAALGQLSGESWRRASALTPRGKNTIIGPGPEIAIDETLSQEIILRPPETDADG